MPTVKPRINLTLHPDEYDLIKRYASLQGVSMAQVIHGFVSLAFDSIERLCELSEQLNNQQRYLNEDLAEGYRRASLQSVSMLGYISELDILTAKYDDPLNAKIPPSVTTGDRSTKANKPNALKGFNK